MWHLLEYVDFVQTGGLAYVRGMMVLKFSKRKKEYLRESEKNTGQEFFLVLEMVYFPHPSDDRGMCMSAQHSFFLVGAQQIPPFRICSCTICSATWYAYMDNISSGTSSTPKGSGSSYFVSACTTVGVRSGSTPAIIRDEHAIKQLSIAITSSARRTRFRWPVSFVNAPPRQIRTVSSRERRWAIIFATRRGTSPFAHAPSHAITVIFGGVVAFFSAYSSQVGHFPIIFAIFTISNSMHLTSELSWVCGAPYISWNQISKIIEIKRSWIIRMFGIFWI